MAIRHMECCVCGDDAGQFEQHWNCDTGYGICRKCVDWVRSRGETDAEILDLYGVEGANYAAPAEQAEGCGMICLDTRLKRLRLSRPAFQAWTGLSARTVGAWCRGEKPTPKHITALIDLADALTEARPDWGPPGSKRA